MNMETRFTSKPSIDEIDFLTSKINEEALRVGIEEKAEPFAFFIYDEKTLIAGCNGSLVYGSIYTDQLWVHKDYRNQGLGKLLMEKIHSLGKKRHCCIATVCTMSFQKTRSFYEKLGYTLDFTRRGYTQESECYFMQKRIT